MLKKFGKGKSKKDLFDIDRIIPKTKKPRVRPEKKSPEEKQEMPTKANNIIIHNHFGEKQENNQQKQEEPKRGINLSILNGTGDNFRTGRFNALRSGEKKKMNYEKLLEDIYSSEKDD